MRLLLDEHIPREAATALHRKFPKLDVVSIYDASWRGLPDPQLLETLDREGFTLITRDVNTIPEFVKAPAGGRNLPLMAESFTLTANAFGSPIFVVLFFETPHSSPNTVPKIGPAAKAGFRAVGKYCSRPQRRRGSGLVCGNDQARRSWTTWPWTSVRRKRRPW